MAAVNPLEAEQLPGTPGALLFSSQKKRDNPSLYFYVLGDSNSQGLFPGASADWNFKIGIGKNMQRPWPVVMENALSRNGVSVFMENHSECGRRLCGVSHDPVERRSLGAKDGREALRAMVGIVFSKHGVKNENVYFFINLGTNDLQDYRITPNYLKESLLKYILTILINPTLQYALFEQFKAYQNEPALSGFLETLTDFMSADINKGYSPVTPPTHDKNLVDEINSHDEGFDKLLSEQIEIVRELFSMISWNFVIVPPVLITGHPFNAFASAELSQHWPSIVQEVVDLIGIKNLTCVPQAQSHCIPNCDEFGGSIHLTPEQHIIFGEEMAKHVLSNKLGFSEKTKVFSPS